MRFLVALTLLALSSVASAQCSNGTCRLPGVRAAAAPVRVVRTVRQRESFRPLRRLFGR